MDKDPRDSERRKTESDAQDIPQQSSSVEEISHGRVRPRKSSSEEDDVGGASSDNGSFNDSCKKKTKGNRSPPMSPVADLMFPGLSASPPRYVSLEEIMKAANGVSNMALAHEIAVNKDFKIEKTEITDDNGLYKQVKDIVHKAFWDVLQEQLSSDPPEYSQAMTLLAEVKEGLLTLLLPQHTRLRSQIDEVLDLQLIRQKAENEVLDFNYYAQYVLSIMAKMCAPVRDEKIRDMMKIQDVVTLFREILQLIEMMKLDMANFTIQQIRPHIQQHSVEYEKNKFEEFLKTQDDGLKLTRNWLRDSYQKIKEQNDKERKEENAERKQKINASEVMNSAYIQLLTWDRIKVFPETLLLDQGRFLDCRDKLADITLTATILLITYSTVGTSIQGISSLKQTLKQNLTTIIGGGESDSNNDDVDLPELLKNLSLQVVKDVDGCLVEHGFKPLDELKKRSLEQQIQQISSNDKIFRLVELRSSEFIKQVLSSVTASPTKIPPGLSSLQPELAKLTGQFLRLVSHNRAVFGDYYAEIISTFDRGDVAN